MISLFILSLSIAIFSTIKIVNSKENLEKTLEAQEKREKVVKKIVEKTANESNEQSTEEEKKPYPKKGDVIGKLIIPAIKEEYPITEGTDDEQLENSVGHYIQSVLPGRQDNSVLAGHRDGVFRKLGDVKIDDVLIVELGEEVYTYKIYKQLIVDQDDRTIIVPHEEAILTLVTCYPFNYIGSAPERYILQAKLVEE
ncbi:class D sortase [Bacillus sp. RD4P76]|uniref:Class D sortase n=2 Tax=Bacillus suaedaesalsae TaxID=2810349 RepID=A0ABS2DJU3_9BACI|nr:class D sortase [Bacillus suaedaesalsae]MBM6618770.1 class D sortase [Bacillus suaedaesalsae]